MDNVTRYSLNRTRILNFCDLKINLIKYLWLLLPLNAINGLTNEKILC